MIYLLLYPVRHFNSTSSRRPTRKNKFGKEYSTNIKLGVIEDTSNRTRLAKLLRFYSSNSDTEQTFLADYVERMKEKQEAIYFIAGTSREEVENPPFVECLLKKGYEVLYLVEPVDEYCIQSLPEFEGKKFQNIAKEDWLKLDSALKDQIEKASSFLTCGQNAHLVHLYYANQKKTLEINPRHPLVKELKTRVEADTKEDETAKDLAKVLFDTATLRSGFSVKDSLEFAQRIERMMKMSMGLDINAPVCFYFCRLLRRNQKKKKQLAAAADVDEEEITAEEDKPSDSDESEDTARDEL
ncbi:hypothetical protein Btru_052467 [Bulinus truncatus]|nr:hypothetical protein Btru_052467 [Bulinus truncatus]